MSLRCGDLLLDMVADVEFGIDGGAMFGVVPRTLWERLAPPDDKNRIRIACNCLLVRRLDGSGPVVLVDTGLGELAGEERMRRLYAIDEPPGLLESNLASVGVDADAISHVILTHLHFDHVGGACVTDARGDRMARFANATYYVNRGELATAGGPDARSAPSYLAGTWEPLVAAGCLTEVDDGAEVVPGVFLEPAPGHTDHHQIVRIESGGETACFLADLIPTPAHMKPHYVMAFDLDPRRSMAEKARILARAQDESGLLLFEHAPGMQGAYLDSGGELQPVVVTAGGPNGRV